MQRATATPALTPEEEAAAREWLADRVPDFLWSSYPFDVPPGRMGVVRYLLTMFQAHGTVPAAPAGAPGAVSAATARPAFGPTGKSFGRSCS